MTRGRAPSVPTRSSPRPSRASAARFPRFWWSSATRSSASCISTISCGSARCREAPAPDRTPVFGQSPPRQARMDGSAGTPLKDAIVRFDPLESVGDRVSQSPSIAYFFPLSGPAERRPRGRQLSMKLPSELGPIHFVGIGGIGMSGIAEVLINLGYCRAGLGRRATTPTSSGCASVAPKCSSAMTPANLGEAAVVVVSTAIRRDNPGAGRGAGAAHSGGAPRRDACRADAAQALRRHRRHARQDDDDLAGRDAARRRRPRPDRHQRRHHQRLRHQRAARRRRLDGGRGRRERRHLPQAARPTSPSSPTSIPSTSTISRPSTRSRTRSSRFVENLPFYGFAVMCLDHPTVQELVGRIEDRRVITYGENPQADVRLLDVDLAGGVTRFNVLIRDRKTGRGDLSSTIWRCRCRAATTRSTPPRRSRSRMSSARRAEVDPQGDRRLRRRQAALHPHRRVERRRDLSTTTATIRSRSPPSCAPPAPRRAARSSPSCSRIAIRGSHRCSTPSRPASTTPTPSSSPTSIRPARRRSRASTRTRWPPRSTRTAIATRWLCRRPTSSRRMIRALASPGDFVVFLGAGNITQWAYALPGELAALDRA